MEQEERREGKLGSAGNKQINKTNYKEQINKNKVACVTDTRALHILGRCSFTQLHPQAQGRFNTTYSPNQRLWGWHLRNDTSD